MGEIDDKRKVLQHVFNQYDRNGKGELNALEVQMLHGDLRMGGISYPQVLASIKYTCSGDTCTQSELYDLLQEMDRRYYLVQDLRWEFSLLDREQKDTITEDQARWLVQAAHGKNFSKRKWAHFLSNRAVPGSKVAFPEIEVLLCNVKSNKDSLLDREEAERERQEKLRKKKLAEEEKLREQERLKKLRDEERKRKEGQTENRIQEQEDMAIKKIPENYKVEEKERQEDEARRRMMEEEELRRREQQRREEEEREREEERLRELEEKNREEEERRRKEEAEKYKDAEKILEETERAEKEYEAHLKKLRDQIKNEKDQRKRRELEEEEEKYLKLHRELKHKRIRYRLKVAIKAKDKYKLEYTITEFKDEKVEDKDMELERAERLLKELVTRDNLRRAISRREIEELEKAIETVKRNGLEVQMAKELIEANQILVRLRKIQRIRSEILELKQSTVAEIRSYQNPPVVVHTVMTATFLILGHKESETKAWKAVQALVGKTGKESLKRRCLECDASKINMAAAKRARQLLDRHELDEVRDVSAGAATFYVFVDGYIQELEDETASIADGYEFTPWGSWEPSVAMIEEAHDIAEKGPVEGSEEGSSEASASKPRVDPSQMVINRSKQQVITSQTKTQTRSRSKTPTRKQ